VICYTFVFFTDNIFHILYLESCVVVLLNFRVFKDSKLLIKSIL